MADVFLSIIVPVQNGEAHIESCLQSLLALDYPREQLEIIVIDNGSRDRTREIVEAFPVTLLTEKVQGAGNARNTGVAHANGAIIGFLDSDCIVDPDWAQSIDRVFQNPETDAVMGLTRGIDDNCWARLEQANFEAFWYDTLGSETRLKRTAIDTRNSAIRKSVLEACDGFDRDVRFCEDLDLSTRLRRQARRIELDDRMRAAHHNRTRLDRILALKESHGFSYGNIVSRQPEGVRSPYLPIDVRSFLWIDNMDGQSRSLIGSRIVLRSMEIVLVAVLRGGVLLGAAPKGIMLKLFKTACAIRWERGLLRAWRETTS